MKKFYAFVICVILFVANCFAQSRYIVKFKNKDTNPFSIANPNAYLSPRALQRRTRHNISIDSTDLPVTPRYIDSVRLAGAVTILNASKWLNQITIRTNDPVALAKINALPFVVNATAVANRNTEIKVEKKLDGLTDEPIANTNILARVTTDVFSYGSSNNQIKIHQGEFLHNHGFKGEGMQVAVLDAGFNRYLNIPTFDSVRINNQIINVWDFVENTNTVNEDDAHGMYCLSIMAANMPGVFVGSAPKANYSLYRTEDVASETRIEEHNLAAGLERADSLGVELVSISLGYNQFDNPAQNYTYANMDGNTAMSTIAADLAAKKGMLSVIAAGNEGARAWKFLMAPSDGDSVLSVGAVNASGVVGAFSSYGPSGNGRVKPNAASVGVGTFVANASNGQPVPSNGTSFATPNLAGLVTCLWQAYPEFNNMTILDAVQKAGSKATAPDDRVGYGITDMKKAFVLLQQKTFTDNITFGRTATNFNFKIKYDSSMKIILERKFSDQTNFSTVKTFNGSGAYLLKTENYTDSYDQLDGKIVSYRLGIVIGIDTTYSLKTYNYGIPAEAITINPNPVVNGTVKIAISQVLNDVDIAVVNSAGQTVYKTIFKQPTGSLAPTILNLNMQGFASGVYYFNFYSNGEKIITKRVLKR
jgi:serine protease AprX